MPFVVKCQQSEIKMKAAFEYSKAAFWLPEKDSNPYKQSQSLSCYHYTIGQYRMCSDDNIYITTWL